MSSTNKNATKSDDLVAVVDPLVGDRKLPVKVTEPAVKVVTI
jgi:hypothetical protein